VPSVCASLPADRARKPDTPGSWARHTGQLGATRGACGRDTRGGRGGLGAEGGVVGGGSGGDCGVAGGGGFGGGEGAIGGAETQREG
jgi:collagen type III alpha